MPIHLYKYNNTAIFVMVSTKHAGIISRYFPNPSSMGSMLLKVNIYAEYSWFEFRVFYLVDQLLKKTVYPTIYP